MTTAISSEALEEAVREAYLEEANDLLRRIALAENDLVTATGEDVIDLIRGIARALHTLKGASAASGETAVREECHRIEEVIDGVVDRTVPFDAVRADALRRGVATLHGLVVNSATPAMLPPPPVLEVLPPPSLPEPIFDLEARDRSDAAAHASDLIRVRPERVDALHALASELVVLRLQSDAQLRRLGATRDALSDVATNIERSVQQIRRARGRSGEALTRLLGGFEGVSDELEVQLRELGDVTSSLHAAEAEVGNVADSILAGVGELRLMPLSPFFESFVRVAREACRNTDSDVRVSIRAEGVELDRAVLMRLREPLLHLVRNAVAHGIEATGARIRAGKNPVGHILLEGRSEGARATLRVVDDGAGIDVARVRATAVSLGILDASDTAELDGERLFEILSRPGFSTRTQADRLAGRGVGLDVVADVVRELGGRIAIETAHGVGTSIAIDVPVTASTSAGLLVRCGSHRFAILLSHVERVVRVRRSDIMRSASAMTIRIENDAVSVVALRSLLDIPVELAEDEGIPGVVVAVARQRLVFLVDELPGEQSLIVRPLPEAFAKATKFVGAAIQEDGSVLPVLDVQNLFELAVRGSISDRHLDALRTTEADVRGTSVLVVDDSVTMRTLLRNILRSAGYDVSVAHDGVAALAALEKMTRCDLVVTDLEMPEMDGVGLCRAIRGSRFARVPIVMVTSVASSEEKSRAVLAGADAYIVKAGFAQEEFLELTRRLVRRDIAAA